MNSLISFFRLPSLWLVFQGMLLCLPFAPAAYSGTISLEVLLSEIDRSPGIVLTNLDHAINSADAKRHTAAQNWELFGGAGLALADEAVDENRSREHTDLNARIGLRYPFIGGNRANERALHIAQGNAQISEIRLVQSTNAIRYQIEKTYAQYWAAQTKATLCDAYSQFTDKMKNILLLRRNAGLLLESDRLELLAGFERVNYIKVHEQALQTQALNKLRRLTGRNWPEFDAVKPPFYKPSTNTPDSYFISASHPELQIINAELENQRKELEASRSDKVHADFVISAGVADEFSGPNGYGVVAGFNFRMPLFYGSYKSADNDFVTANIRKTEFLHLQRSGLLIEQARLTESLYHDYVTRLQLNMLQWNSLRRAVDERSRRVKRLDGDVLNELLSSMYHYFTQSIEVLDVQMRLWGTLVNLRQFPLWVEGLDAEEQIDIPDYRDLSDVIFASQAVINAATYSRPDSIARQPDSSRFNVYVWGSRSVLNQLKPAFWKQLRDKKVGRILLSLDAEQIEEAARNPSVLEAFMALADKHDVAVDLLLGEPEWARQEQRDKLFDIITNLNKLPFDGLNLDIEPDSLKQPVSSALLKDWLETLRIANAMSPWPVSITLHYRYLQPVEGEICVPCVLISSGIKDVVAMVFVSNPGRVIEIVSPILKAYPELRINVAQSFERHLSRDESYASFSAEESGRRLIQVRKGLSERDNFSGISIQSWFGFRNPN